MKAWEKIEEKLNLLLESLMKILNAFVNKSTPASIKNEINKRKNKPLVDVQALQNKLLGIKSFFDGINKKFNEFLGRIILFFKSLNKDSVKPEKLLLGITAVLSPFLGRIRDWYIGLKPTTMLAMVSITTIGGLSSIAIYQEVTKISEKSRGPASEMVEEVQGTVASRRPAYYKKQERELRIRNVSFPVYAGRKPASKLVMDFTFVASNRYIKEYFDDFDNSHKLKDRLNTRVEQILPDFPLTDDGKRVIKDKIKKEMQALIDDLNIEGSIEEVHIHSIISG